MDIVNTQNRILDAAGPLAILWSETQKVKKGGIGLHPGNIINIVQRGLELIGNIHFVYMNDRRNTMLAKSICT